MCGISSHGCVNCVEIRFHGMQDVRKGARALHMSVILSQNLKLLVPDA